MFVKKKIYNKTTVKNCADCVYSKKLEFGKETFCSKKGIVSANDYCRRHKYDPLKRVPGSKIISSDFSEDDFKI